jgi:4-aminobutyrate aminotransferase-like enzyme
MKTSRTLALLQEYESRNVTYVAEDGGWPIVWERAKGVHVWDDQGRRYLDLTAAFGVATTGHANARVVRAARNQMGRLLHAMGDVHPHPLKAELARELSRLTFERWSKLNTGKKSGGRPELTKGKTIFGSAGFEAVEAALKTAALATGKPGVIAFEGAYHGLGYGALNATHRAHFRSPFRRQLGEFARFAPFPHDGATLDQATTKVRAILHQGDVGAVLVEPIQVRGGINVPPPDFLRRLRRLCDEQRALLVLDEIYTGFGRTGRWFACEHSGVTPDLICLGKALTGGFPLSACVGHAEVMDAAWPRSSGEAIHTSTFLGHPVGCAMALAQIAEIRRMDLVHRANLLGTTLLARLRRLVQKPGRKTLARGVGLLAGLELRNRAGGPDGDLAIKTVRAMLRKGFVLLPEGGHGNVIGFTPPLTITPGQLKTTLDALDSALALAASRRKPGSE